MIEERTCLILGAGASAPYGFPTGVQLRDLLLVRKAANSATTAERFKPPGNCRDATSPHGQPVILSHEWLRYFNEMAHAAGLDDQVEPFRDKFFAAGRSIDWFLRYREENFGEIARLFIAAVLLGCEREDKLCGDWYELLLQRLIPAGPESLEANKLGIITFNYDRSFERYFRRALEAQYDLSPEDAGQLFSRIRIEHVYGQLGTLEEVPYGDYKQARRASEGIRLIRPQPDPQIQSGIQSILGQSYYVNFLGFGFDADNLGLFLANAFRNRRIYSTGCGLRDATTRQRAQSLGVYFHSPDLELKSDELFLATNLFGPKIEIASDRDDEEPPGYDLC